MTISRRSKWVVAVVAGGCLLLAALIFWPFCFWYYSVCSQCGLIRHTTEWQLPGTFFSFFGHSSTEPTVLSRYLTSSGLVSAHSHQWLFGHGGGNGVRCALGAGDSIRPSVESSQVVRFLELVRQYGEPGETAKFLRYTFDRDMSRSVWDLGFDIPTNGLHSREAFRAWLNRNDWTIDTLGMLKKRF